MTSESALIFLDDLLDFRVHHLGAAVGAVGVVFHFHYFAHFEAIHDFRRVFHQDEHGVRVTAPDAELVRALNTLRGDFHTLKLELAVFRWIGLSVTPLSGEDRFLVSPSSGLGP